MAQLTSDALAFDVRELVRDRLLRCWSRFEWVWKKGGAGTETSVKVTVLQDLLEVKPLHASQNRPQSIQLTYSTGHQGSRRPWFLCPSCSRRTAILYHQTGGLLSCRICNHLVYQSQYKTRDRSYGRRHRGLSLRSVLCR